jgi:hypothetical protein
MVVFGKMNLSLSLAGKAGADMSMPSWRCCVVCARGFYEPSGNKFARGENETVPITWLLW